MGRRIRIGVIGYGRMGRGFVSTMQAKSDVWEIVSICDLHAPTRKLAATAVPHAKIVSDEAEIFHDKTLDVVGLFTLADARPRQIKSALAAGFHVIAEKPIGPASKIEWELVDLIEASGKLVAVNIFNRNAWYHKEIQAHIAAGQIGQLAVIRVCHMTPGHMPTEGHDPEGPPFHDCGMHYVDVARWYANSEYHTYHAQGLRMWGHKDPWWVQCHGTFKNGVVFDITQGFVYGHLAREKTHNCYVDCIGTQGIARMRHNFKDATIEIHGIDTTIHKSAPFNDKKLDVMCDIFARSFIAGKNLGFPTARDSVIASEVSWAMLKDAIKHEPPVVGTPVEMQQILEHRRSLRNGFGLPVRPGECPPPNCPSQACGEDICAAQEARPTPVYRDACA